MMNHLTSDQLVDFIHGEVTPADDALAHAHLASCEACRAEADAEIALREFLRTAAVAEEREMPSTINAAVWAQVRAAKPGPLAALTALLRPMIAIPVAAVLVAVGVLASPLGHHENRPTIAASYYLQTHAVQSSQSPLSERANQAAIANAYDGGYPATAAYGGSR